MADTKKEYTSNLHPKGDLGTTVYPNVKSENIIDKDTTAYTAGKVPDSSLVSKSLDGLNEKIETNKIQTDTNKTNIATLQGDVSSLKSDNQTTKTTIVGLVSADTTNKANIAKNTQDIATNTQNIENLSAVTPTDINVDSDFNLVLEHDGQVITGQKKLNKIFKNTDGVFTYKDKIRFYTESNNNGNTFLYTLNKNNDYDVYEGGFKYFQYIWNNSAIASFGIYAKSNDISYPFRIIFQIESNLLTNKAEYLINLIDPNDPYKRINIHFPPKSGTLALVEDLATKQSTLYRHTVLISEPTNKTAYLAFTAESEKNTPIDSIQDLITVFGNTSIACSGLYRDGDPSNEKSLLMINVGTSISNTTIASATLENSSITSFSNALFTDIFDTGFTITDNVTAM